MKRYAFIIPLVFLAAACNQPKLQEQVAQLQAENLELQEASLDKDQSLAEFVESFSDIEKNLAEIRERELNITLSNSDVNTSEDTHKRVAEDIKMINELMSENKRTIEELNSKIASASGKNSQLRKALEKAKKDLTAQIEERDSQIAELKSSLEVRDFTIQELNANLDTLTLANSEQLQTIEEQTHQLNTAFYTIGTSKELVASNVLSKDGGFLGLGKTEKLKADFNNDQFNRIDITNTQAIPLSGKKAELVTSHPTDSYMLEGDQDENLERLVILDPDRFWNSSKYLVVVLD